jgi:hypothetical protein
MESVNRAERVKKIKKDREFSDTVNGGSSFLLELLQSRKFKLNEEHHIKFCIIGTHTVGPDNLYQFTKNDTFVKSPRTVLSFDIVN